MVKKILFLIICFLTASGSFAQQPTIINIIKSLSSSAGPDGIMHAISPVFEHDGSTLAADSARWNMQQNSFDAFGHVVITQPDGKLIYSDILNYNGNTHVAILTKNVRLVDERKATLSTDLFIYNLSTKNGVYTTGGKIVDGENVLASKTGYYFGNTKDAYFRYNVVITNKDAVIKADTMRYNEINTTAYFFGPTHIYGKKDTLYTEEGEYNTKTRQANGYKNNLYQQGGRTLKSDTMFYDDEKGTSTARNNIIFNDSEQKIAMYGDAGFYARADSSILLTKNPYLSFVTQDSGRVDTIWMAADTLYSKLVLKKSLIPLKWPLLSSFSILKDTRIAALIYKSYPPVITKHMENLQDTLKTRLVSAYRNLKIYKSDMQAVADSMSYNYADSVIRIYGSPMVWSQEGTQISGDTILMQLKNKKLDNMLIQQNGLIVNTEGDSTRFNQIKGRLMAGVFRDNQLKQMFIDGNAERIYFIKDSTSNSSMNHTTSSGMYFELGTKKLLKLYSSNPEGTLFPMKDVTQEDSILKGFVWKPKDRPKSKEEIIPQKDRPLAVVPAPIKPVKTTPKPAVPVKPKTP